MTGLQLNEFRKLLAAFEATYLQHSLQELTLAGHARQRHVGGGAKCTSLNLEQFVEGRKRCLWAREAIDEAHVVAGDELCNDEERRRASARFYAPQSMINWATWFWVVSLNCR